jgi:hypothetical protein
MSLPAHSAWFAALLCGVGSIVASAQDNRQFRAVAVEANERQATLEAYYQGVNDELSALAGAQGQTTIGAEFRAEMERDFENFRRRYFTADTDARCAPRGNRVACEVTGGIRVGALQQALRASLRTTEQTLSNSLTFAVTAAVSKDADASLVIDTLTGAITSSGHHVLIGSAVSRAIELGQIDYSLAIQQVNYGAFSFDPLELRADGSLTIRFAALDVRRKLQIAVVPVIATATASGPSLEAERTELRRALAAKATAEIVRQLNSSIVTVQQEAKSDYAAKQRQSSGQILYLVRLEGLAQRDRERIRSARDALARVAPAAVIAVDPQRSSETEVTIAVTASGAVRVDDLIDALYAANSGDASFEAISTGTNQIKVHY